MSRVVLTDVSKHYGPSVAVERLSLAISEGEFVALLGPSGCGKTTTLRMIAGFVEVTSGQISIGEKDITSYPPNRRNIGLVFQNYALFPHMSVAENVAFGLKMRKTTKAELERRVREALDRVRLDSLGDRLPKQLSGGQQQRVALARALVIEPDVLLLDEPLSNLDAALRLEMKHEIRQLQQRLGLTTIFVTHDQDEAMSTADRMVLMRSGRIEQIGSPETIYDQPRTRFAAEFMGFTNLLSGDVDDDGMMALEGGETILLRKPIPAGSSRRILAIRPEMLQVASAGDKVPTGQSSFPATVSTATFRGSVVDYRLHMRSGQHLVTRQTAPAMGGPTLLAAGTSVNVSWPESAGVLIAEG
jgi:putative spermidine/putrescine transport system ATP-binding protein